MYLCTLYDGNEVYSDGRMCDKNHESCILLARERHNFPNAQIDSQYQTTPNT